MAMKRILLALTITTFALASQADNLSDQLSRLGFTEKKPLKPDSDSWRAANHSSPAYFVDARNGLVVREPKDSELYPEQISYDAGDVRYVGVDRGEFGGGLYAHQSDDKRLLFEGNIKALIPIKGDLYILSGLAHGISSRGAVHVIRAYERPSKPVQVTLLPDAPRAFTLAERWKGVPSIVIAGHSSLMVFIPDSELDIKISDAFWSGLYPSSIVEHDGHYILGIRSGVVAVGTNYLDRDVRYFAASE